MRAYAVVMATSLYHQKNGCSVLFSVRKADQEYLREYLEGAFLLIRYFTSRSHFSFVSTDREPDTGQFEPGFE